MGNFQWRKLLNFERNLPKNNFSWVVILCINNADKQFVMFTIIHYIYSIKLSKCMY